MENIEPNPANEKYTPWDYKRGNYEAYFKKWVDEKGDESHIARKIQGAEVQEDIIGLDVGINWDHEKGIITSINFIVENNEIKLGDIFSTSPYGLIKKNRTGIGATTLELKAPRNSIIVLPTKALAFEKTLTGRSDDGKYHYVYVGSKVIDAPLDMPSLDSYLLDNEITHKKILVVADSLPKVIKRIGNTVYKDYFFMIDEIDLFQSDSTYRPALEAVIDYYFEFDKRNRCMVSATMQGFTNPKINEEPIIEVLYKEPQQRNIDLIHTNEPLLIAKEKIEELFRDTDEKIVIAYNKVKYIRYIIELLDEPCKSECAILCSSQSSHHAGKYYDELIDGKLNKRITFLTCSYFAGIDIYDRFHLLSISNVELIYTLLSPDRYTQIAGRCRDKSGLYSETIIYNTMALNANERQGINEYKEYLLHYTHDIQEFINHAKELESKYFSTKDSFRRLLSDKFSEIKTEILEKSKKTYFGSVEVSLVRQNIVTKKFEPSYFVIDSITESLHLRKELYVEPATLFDLLKKQHNIIKYLQNENRELTVQQQGILKIANEEYKNIDKEYLDALICEIFGYYEEGVLENRWHILERKATRDQKEFLRRIKKLSAYLSIEYLIQNVSMWNHKTEFRHYNNAVIFWALADDHVFKSDMQGKFKEGHEYTSDEIKDKINEVYRTHFNEEIPKNIQVRIFRGYFEAKRIDNRRGIYKLLSYNKLGFTQKPLSIIKGDADWKRLIEFSWKD